MYSKTIRFATCSVAMLFLAGCVSAPWENQPIGDEINLAFAISNNLLVARSLRIDGNSGRFLIGTASSTSVIDPAFAGGTTHSLQLNERTSLSFSSVGIDLKGVGDAIIGANVWGDHSLTIDFASGLMIYQRDGIHSELMKTYQYQDEPMITIVVDGHTIPAIVDTTLPDTLALPGEGTSRRSARVAIANVDFGNIDVRVGGVATARVGNRLLSKFLISIDYGHHVVGLWRDPRIPM
jgi:hypothetical protein